jgi:hypothetical protein
LISCTKGRDHNVLDVAEMIEYQSEGKQVRKVRVKTKKTLTTWRGEALRTREILLW